MRIEWEKALGIVLYVLQHRGNADDDRVDGEVTGESDSSG
jgi:hypothetical protein